MLAKITPVFVLFSLMLAATIYGQARKFSLGATITPLSGKARPHAFFDVIGRKAAVLGRENGTFEAWVFPFQILENFNLKYRFPDMPAPDDLSHYAESVEVLPERTTIIYSHPLFTLRQHIFVPAGEPAIAMLLQVDAYRESGI